MLYTMLDSIADTFNNSFSDLSYDYGNFNLYDDKENYYVDIDLPGVNKEDVSLALKNNLLKITYKRNKPIDKMITVNSKYGEFTKHIRIKSDISESDISAKFNNGVLTIVVPKTTKELDRLIEIT